MTYTAMRSSVSFESSGIWKLSQLLAKLGSLRSIISVLWWMWCVSDCRHVSVCLSVCMDISSTRNHTSKIHQILFACYLWPWLIVFLSLVL